MNVKQHDREHLNGKTEIRDSECGNKTNIISIS